MDVVLYVLKAPRTCLQLAAFDPVLVAHRHRRELNLETESFENFHFSLFSEEVVASVENRVLSLTKYLRVLDFTEYWTLMSMLVVVLNMLEKKVKRDQPVLKR